MAAHQGITKDAPSFPLFLLVLALTSVRPATCFLPSSSQQSTTAQHSRSHQVVSIGNYYPHAGRQHQVDPSVTRLELTSSDDDDDDAALLQAKLHVLEDVVVKLNGTKYQDQEEILTLQAKLGGLEETLEQQKDQFDEELESKASQVQQDLTTTFQQEITALETEHAEQAAEHRPDRRRRFVVQSRASAAAEEEADLTRRQHHRVTAVERAHRGVVR